MKLEDYLNNPMGKGSALVNNTDAKASLDAKYEKVRFRIMAKYYLYENRFIIAHIKIPSGSYPDVRYDVIIQIDLESIPSDNTINNAEARFFSNCPSFIFSHAHAFKTRNIICDWLEQKLDSKVFTMQSTVRNPYDIIGYEKSIYFACKFITSFGRSSKGFFIANSTRVHDISIIRNSVKSQTLIMLEYNKAAEKERQEKEREKKKAQYEKNKAKLTSELKSGNGRVAKTGSTGKTGKARSVSKSTKIKKI